MTDNNKHEDEINFKNVLKNPIRWFGSIYIYFIIVIIIIGFYYLINLSNIVRNNIPASVQEPEVITDFTEQKGEIIPAVNPSLILSPDEDVIKNGKELFNANCVTCHGETGKGDGIAGSALNPKPRNFTSESNWKNGRKLSDIYKTLDEGVAGSAMIPYNFLSIEDRLSLIHYIRTFADNFPELTEQEINELNNTYKLNETRVIPNHIPITKAIEIISNETDKNSQNNFTYFLTKINSHDNFNLLVKNFVLNNQKFFNFLSNFRSWEESPEKFYKTLVANMNGIGISSDFININQSDLNTFYENLKKIKLM